MSLKRPLTSVDTHFLEVDSPGHVHKKTASASFVVENEVNSACFRTYNATQKSRPFSSGIPNRMCAELLKELEALIIPGVTTEMPPYDIRRELQRRYNVDRRLIYDWFRGKGLRVKEDRLLVSYSSPTPRRNSQQHRQITIRHCSTSSENSPVLSSSSSLSHFNRLETPSSIYASSPSLPVTRSAPGTPAIGHPRGLDISGCSEKTERPAVSWPYEASYAPDLYESPLLDTSQYDFSPVVGEDGELYYDEEYDSPWRPATLLDSLEFGAEVSPSPEDLVPLDQRPLKQEERIAVYNFISAAIGPAHGIQESVGTYGAYMKEQSGAHYDRLLAPYQKERQPIERSHLGAPPSPHSSSGTVIEGHGLHLDEVIWVPVSTIASTLHPSQALDRSSTHPPSEVGDHRSNERPLYPEPISKSRKLVFLSESYGAYSGSSSKSSVSVLSPPERRISMDEVLSSRQSARPCLVHRYEHGGKVRGGRPRTTSAGGGL
ncbi:hypothetical protein GLOTRDRAFT_123866 [Gloeophyllum trabeum ATCC 11539]|uniref:Uncharacterized protein n=1 Tax=Gloeophyllum trabeum (strain ATCC 11539 / FP-39264 / Madison 617) TaxID=670483 RepID=S7S2U4_GLOTA|nr:uncharacterized protein GLOTRDRAFT_123866 [Gloeophyllum trabeum ATCC 11539]EPQ60109.1 hypothetical protein GLOTRDRAFT_123866 [Gloeophyllum trabeum ATCC 11539]